MIGTPKRSRNGSAQLPSDGCRYTGARLQDLQNPQRMQQLRSRIPDTVRVLVIDEISMLDAPMLPMISTILCHIRGNSLPFGGLCVLLVGDFFQLPPVGVSLLDAALPKLGVPSSPDDGGDANAGIVHCTTHGLAVQHAGALFRQFRRFELQPHANGRSQDARLSRVLASFRRVDGKPPLTPADLRSLQSLSATDIATTPEVVHSA